MEVDGVHVVVQCPFSVALLDTGMSSAILKGHWLIKQRPLPSPPNLLLTGLHRFHQCVTVDCYVVEE